MQAQLKRLYNEGYQINIFQYLENNSELIILEKDKKTFFMDIEDVLHTLDDKPELIIDKLIKVLLFSGDFDLIDYAINKKFKTVDVSFKNKNF